MKTQLRKNKIKNEYFGECHALCISGNRNGISQICPKFSQFIFLAEFFIDIQLHLFWLKQVILENAISDLIRAMFIKTAITLIMGLIMGLSGKFFGLNVPWNPFYQRKFFYFIPLKGPGPNGLILWSFHVPNSDFPISL